MESSEFSQNCRLPFLKKEAHICFPVYEQLQTNAALLFFFILQAVEGQIGAIGNNAGVKKGVQDGPFYSVLYTS